MSSQPTPPKNPAGKWDVWRKPKRGKEIIPYMEEGLMLLNEDHVAEAIPLLERAVAERPRYADYHYHLARAYHRAERIPEAIATLQKALEINPNYTMALNDLGILYGLIGDYEKAREQHRLAAQSFSYRTTEKNPFAAQDAATERFNQGIELHRQGRTQEAKKAFLEAANLKPGSWDIRFHLALADYSAGRLHAAEARAQDLLLEDPHNVKVLALAADVAIEKRNFTQAQTCLERAIQHAPDYPDLHLRMGVLFLEQEVYGEAMWFLERAVELNDNYAEAYFYLSQAYLGQNLYAEAQDALERCMQLAPKPDPFHHICLAEIFEKRAERGKAMHEYQKVVNDPGCGEFAREKLKALGA
ncbi:tetratricopeptide repeat protein [bacterium]|nr:tetratricopeptide repeat protein [bacterium]